jgi:enoyl-CoA hydratase/carnithine racemase
VHSIGDLAQIWELPSAVPPELLVIDLDQPAGPDEVARAAEVVARHRGVSLGVARGPLAGLDRLLDALTTTITTASDPERRMVQVADLAGAARAVRESVQRTPLAAASLATVLPLTAAAGTRDGLVVESLAYSMLQAGPEFAEWLGARRPPRPASTGPRVKMERKGSTLRVQLCRPERRNALDARMRDELLEALVVARADPALQVELTGEGPSFCSGGDLDEFGSLRDPVHAHLIRTERSVGAAIAELAHRVTVTVHGASAGSGVELAAFASRVVATPDATFLLPELRMGLIPGAGGTVSVTRRIGRWRTAWMVLTAQPIDAVTALSWGLVDVVGEPDPRP